MSDTFTIKVDHVDKTFKLPHEKNSSVKGAVINFYKKKKSYEKQQVLKDISFEVKKGEFFGIVGRNGSGKSTLLKLLAGIYDPDKGQIQIKGKLTPFIELGVGFNPELTGRENVFLNGALLGFNRKEMEVMYESIVTFAELRKFMDQKLKNYSSGMQVRLAFSIAIRADSEILLLDEVLAVGDAAFQKKCFDYFMLLKKSGRTVILVTHDMGAVRQYCDRAIMIENGAIVKRGKPEVIAQAYQKQFATESITEETKVTNKKTAKENDMRWGSGKLIVEQVEVVVDDESIAISALYKAKVSVPSPILGFSINDSANTNIIEGNTKRSKYKTFPMQTGEYATIKWLIPNVLKDGKYYVSIACCDQSAVEFYDWLNEASEFTIDRYNPTAGVVAPQIRITDYAKNGGSNE